LRLIDDEPGISFTDLAKKTRFERSATSRILSRLVKNGLAKRKIDGDDARRFLFFSTAKARALRADVDPISLELEALVLSPLREEERRQFLTVLNKIADWLKGDAALKEMQRLYPDSRPADKTPAANRGKRPRGETAAS